MEVKKNMFKVERLVVGFLGENCYIVSNNNDALIIDPGDEGGKIISFIKEHKYNVKAILITHYHFDHIGALESIKNEFKVDVIDYNNQVSVDGFDFEIIKNYGHTLDCVSYYFKKEKVMFTGDFIFKDTIGNYKDENYKVMLESLIKFKNGNYNGVTIYPGHGDETNYDYEIENNPFLKGL